MEKVVNTELTVMFVVPYNGELPESFGIKKLSGDLVEILSSFRSLNSVVGAYAALTAEQLAVLITERAALHSPELVMITELGVDYGNSFMLYSEFMDLVSINDLESELSSYGVAVKENSSKETNEGASRFGLKDSNDVAPKVSETYNDLS